MTDISPLLKGRAVYRRLLRDSREDWGLFVLALLGMIGYAAMETAFAALMKPLLDGSFIAKDPWSVRWIPALIAAVFIVRGVSHFTSAYSLSVIGQNLVLRLRHRLFERCLQWPDAAYQEYSSGQLIARLTHHVERVSQAVTTAAITLIRDNLTVLGLLSFMVYTSPLLALVFLLLCPFIALLFAILHRRLRFFNHQTQDRVAALTHISEEAIHSQRLVKAFGSKDYELSRFAQQSEALRMWNLRIARLHNIGVSVIQSLVVTALIIVVYFALQKDMHDQISVGSFISFLTALMLLFNPLRGLTMVSQPLQQGIAAGQRIFEILDHAIEPNDGPDMPPIAGTIAYQAVCYRYPTARRNSLRNICFDLKKGQQMAIVGRSGSGKTTLANLLLRFAEPQQGRILIDGFPIDRYNLASLRRQIAYVGQDSILFQDSVAANIAYGSTKKHPLKKLEEVAKQAHADDFIRSLPEGYDSIIGPHGSKLSGGQRQRIAIARALLKNAPILILDEATSALDSITEQSINMALAQLFQDRSSLIIAHRWSTIRHAQHILLLHEGRICGSGSHAELLATNTLYADLYHGKKKL